ncbi:MAG: hypothetical protein D6820_09995, partial [Lentisphaerae bacterium]
NKITAEGDGLVWSMTFDEAGREVREPDLRNSLVRIQFNGWKMEKRVTSPWRLGESREFVLSCPITSEGKERSGLSISARNNYGDRYEVLYSVRDAAYVVRIPGFKRTWQGGYREIRNYDEIILTINRRNADGQYIPVLFDTRGLANITGFAPVLCTEKGWPTGIPVQLSKNAHFGKYAMLYSMLPLTKAREQYRLRIAYGFWGKLPVASHGQLSIHGYGGNGRWSQLSLGCWGETMCLNEDTSLASVMITDVRSPFIRNGRNGKKWQWSGGPWGGDWMRLNDGDGRKLPRTAFKSAYVSHGPCLTKVVYGGYYGNDHQVAFKAQVSILRTDDYARILQRFHYRFNKPVATKGSYLFMMGPSRNFLTPTIAWGHRDGLVEERKVPGNLAPGSFFRKQVTVSGPAPWWVAFPDGYLYQSRDWGNGTRALIIRSFQAHLGGRTITTPTLSFPVMLQKSEVGQVGCNLQIVVPPEIEYFRTGDSVEMELEWITLPRNADDYYGPNTTFLNFLRKHPHSWQLVWREARGNDLRISVQGGRCLHTYPVVVEVKEPETAVSIEGGVGAIPICFVGLKSATKFTLFQEKGGRRLPFDQAEHGNDFWQTDYDAKSQSYRVTYNLPLDRLPYSKWILSQQPNANGKN